MNQINLKEPKTLITTFVVVFILIAIPLTVISVVTTRDERSKAAGGPVTLYLAPATQSYTVNSNIVVQVRENSATTQVTAVDAAVTYDATKMDFVSIDAASTSDFTSEAVTAGGGSGTVSFSRYVPPVALPCPGTPPCPGVVTGDRLVATIRFKAKIVPATTNLDFAAGAAVYQASDGVNGVGTITGATYTITDPPPAVNITSPANNALVNGSALTVTADATDNIGITKVDFYKDTDTIPLSTDTAPNTGTNTYSFVLNTTTLTNAAHTLKAIATDTNGTTTASQISVTVDNSAPATSITAPTNGLKVSKTVTVNATATDNRAITKVEFYVDSSPTPKFTDTLTPFTFNWDTTLETSANHTLTAKAFDGINTTTSSVLTVTVDNTPPTKPTLSGSASSQTQINLSWTASTDTQGSVTYDVYRNGVKVNPTPLTVLTYPDTGLTASTSYNYFVRVSDQIPVPNTVDTTTITIVTLAPFKTGDINRDGSVNSADLAILISTWGSTTDLRADITLDGQVNSADLAVLLSRWGT